MNLCVYRNHNQLLISTNSFLRMPGYSLIASLPEDALDAFLGTLLGAACILAEDEPLYNRIEFIIYRYANHGWLRTSSA